MTESKISKKNSRSNLKDQIKKIPDKPGIYFFIDSKNKILYIGRAISLKRRLANYFQKNLESRIREMVNLAKTIKFQTTDNLLEAIIYEALAIKKHWPKYNIKDNDDRSFIYIVIDENQKYPKPIIVRSKEADKFLNTARKKIHIFGPYQSLYLVKNALQIIRRIFPYSLCKPNSKPCFDYQIHMCPGICCGQILISDYRRNISHIVMLLNGQKQKLLSKLIKENPEKAKALKHIQDVTLLQKENSLIKIKSFRRLEGYDISHLSGRETFGAMVVFSDFLPDKKSYRLFKIKSAPAHDDLRALAEMVQRRFKHLEWPKPDLILIDGGKPQVQFLSLVLSRLKINIPLVGLSKMDNDRLVFGKNIKKSTEEMILTLYDNLKSLRDEAHRFANRGRKSQKNI
ncbi:MAG: GIY-YIG nuclease family protein [Candidatus Parcubacteria bacterium]|nr:GIY-YIG nuclease family protein [Candidatus Parcubacteria bacterium]